MTTKPMTNFTEEISKKINKSRNNKRLYRISNKKTPLTKRKYKGIYYIEKEDIKTNANILGHTYFEKSKKNVPQGDTVLLKSQKCLIYPPHPSDKISGYYQTYKGEFISFTKKKFLFLKKIIFLLFLFSALGIVTLEGFKYFKEKSKISIEVDSYKIIDQVILPEEEYIKPDNRNNENIGSFITSVAAGAVYNVKENTFTGTEIGNHSKNGLECYFSITSNEEVYYKSPILSPGAKLKGFTLDKKLPSDVNKVTVKYYIIHNEIVKPIANIEISINRK